ncbi:MAG: MarR family winged helix-turn-helix transcriptional regulator [Chloroflexota bacterium]
MRNTSAGVSASDRTEDIIARFRSAFRELRCIGSERLVRQGVSMSHLHIVSMLERHGEMPMSRVAERLDVSFSNATGLIDRMEERGLVERVRLADDRRVVIVRVTDHGRRMLVELEVLKDDFLRQVLGRLDDRQLARVGHAMDDLVEAVAKVIVDDPESSLHVHAHLHALGSSVQPSGAADPAVSSVTAS